MSKLQRFPYLLLLCLLLETSLGESQAADDAQAETLYWEAVSFHAASKYAEALAKLQDAVKLAPQNEWYAAYALDLQQRAARDRLAQHALKTPPDVEKSLPGLARYLVKPCKNNRDKAWLIYRWITDRIAYDVEGLAKQRIHDQRPETVLRTRIATSDGFSNLYELLGKLAGLEVVSIRGDLREGGQIFPHTWNAVKVDKNWLLLDATWGGTGWEDQKAVKKFSDYHFGPPPEAYLFSHLPKDPRWQLVAKPFPTAAIARWPEVNGNLLRMGVKPADILAKVQDKKTRALVDGFELPPGPPVTLLAIPLEKHLKAGMEYLFRIEAPGLQEVVFHDGKNGTQLTKKGQLYEGTVKPEKGKLLIACKVPGVKDYPIMLQYEVE